jgi:ribosomal protein S18 acetylase RimI-like enzyme
MDEPQLVVRRFAPTEAGVWRSIRIDALRDAPEAFGQTLEHAEQQPLSDFESTVSGSFPPFAAFDDGKVVGTAGFYILGGPKMSHRGVLWGMYVASAHRRRGVGRKLVAAIIDHARELVDQVHLHVVTTNAAAYGFYRSMGFVTYGVEPRALRHDGRDYDEAMMVLLLR